MARWRVRCARRAPTAAGRIELARQFPLTEVCPATLPDAQDQAVPLVLRADPSRLWLFRPRPRVRGHQRGRPGGPKTRARCGLRGQRSKRRQCRCASGDHGAARRCPRGCWGGGLRAGSVRGSPGSPQAHWLSLPLRPLALGADLIPPQPVGLRGRPARWGDPTQPSLETPFLGPDTTRLCCLLQASSDLRMQVAPACHLQGKRGCSRGLEAATMG